MSVCEEREQEAPVDTQRAASPGFRCVSMKSNRSIGLPPDLSDGPAVTSLKTKRAAPPLQPPDVSDESEPFDPVYVSSQTSTSPYCHNYISHHDSEAALQLDSHQPVHDDLQRVKDQHKTSMKSKYESLFEETKLQENQTLLNRIYTQLYIIEGESEGVNEEHEVLQKEKSYMTLQDTSIYCNDIFNPLSEPGFEEMRRDKKDQIKTVLTKGITGIGKTVSVQKFILDWAEGKASQDVDFMFVLPFRELNLIKDNQYNLHRLLLDFHPKLEDWNSRIYDKCKVVFIFDGLDESRISLMFSDSIDVTNASVYSGICKIFREESEIYHRKVYSFVHLSFQEFFAAFFASLFFLFYCYLHKNSEAFKMFLKEESITHCENVPLDVLLKGAVNKALNSGNGPLDLFLQFLHGITLESNQRLLKDVLIHTENNTESIKKIIQNLKQGQKSNISPERWINLSLCLIEMKNNSVVKEVQELLISKAKSQSISLAQCSTLAKMILMSEEVLDEFDLKQYNIKSKGRWRLLPAVRNCRKALLVGCNLTDQHCEIVASALQSSNNPLRELNLSNNDLHDSGVKLLCAGLNSPNCQLHILRLSGCMVTVEGCAALASALSSNPSHLRELDLSYNYPGNSGLKLLSDTLNHLDKLNVDHGGEFRIRSGLHKYACDLTLDPNTANVFLILSEDNRKVTCVNEPQSYPVHPERFDGRPQVLCKESLTGRCYWEAEWSGDRAAAISVAYIGIKRKGGLFSNDCMFGYNENSWSLFCSDYGLTVRHNDYSTSISAGLGSCKRVGVYLDVPAGTLSFYSVSDTHKLTHLHTFTHTFTQPLYAGFRLYNSNSSVSLCHIKFKTD